MKKYSLIVLLSSVVMIENSNAQTQQPPPPKLPDEIKLTVTPAELDVISDGLQTQPFAKVAPLMAKLRQQVQQLLDVKPEEK